MCGAAFSDLRTMENLGLISETLVCSCGSYIHTRLSVNLYINIHECVCMHVFVCTCAVRYSFKF